MDMYAVVINTCCDLCYSYSFQVVYVSAIVLPLLLIYVFAVTPLYSIRHITWKVSDLANTGYVTKNIAIYPAITASRVEENFSEQSTSNTLTASLKPDQGTLHVLQKTQRASHLINNSALVTQLADAKAQDENHPTQHEMVINEENNTFVYNGTPDWHGISKPYFYAYSAFFMDESIFGNASIVIIGKKKNGVREINCNFDHHHGYSNGTFTEIKKEVDSKQKHIFVLSCPVNATMFSVPNMVHLSLPQNCTPIASVPVEIPQRPVKSESDANKYSLLICLKVLYVPDKFPDINVLQFIEWVELNRILGVDHISVYIQNTTAEMERVLTQYARTGYIDLRSKQVTPGDKPSTKPVRHFGLNDCLYRNIHYDRIIMIDSDEFIVPQNHSSISAMIKDLDVNSQKSYTSLQFRNTVFFTDLPGKEVTENMLLTQKALYHVEPEGMARQKYIVDPKSCLFAGTHFCTVNRKKHHILQINTTVGSSQHYKACKSSRQEHLFHMYNCTHPQMDLYYDAGLTRFGSELQTAVTERLHKLHLDKIAT